MKLVEHMKGLEVTDMTPEYRLKLLAKVLNEDSDSITEDAVLKYLERHIPQCRLWASAILDNPEAAEEDKNLAIEFVHRDWLCLQGQLKDAQLSAYHDYTCNYHEI